MIMKDAQGGLELCNLGFSFVPSPMEGSSRSG